MDPERLERIKEMMRSRGMSDEDIDARIKQFSGGSSGGSATPKKKPREPVTLDIPGSFLDGDLDGDRQIGLYEWRKWKNTNVMTEFFALDSNQDGFLTPRELVLAEKTGIDQILAEARASAPPAPTRAAGSSSTETASTASSESTSSTSSSSGSSAAAAPTSQNTSLVESQAKRYHSLLDKNKNGVIDPDEWDRSKRLKPKFEAAGAEMNAPMDLDTFVKHYVAISAAD